jgi:hypothetical protein
MILQKSFVRERVPGRASEHRLQSLRLIEGNFERDNDRAILRQ